MTTETKRTPTHFLAERDRGNGNIDYAVMCNFPGDGTKNVLIAEGLSHKHATFIVRACKAHNELVEFVNEIKLKLARDKDPELRMLCRKAIALSAKARGEV